jgi:DNA-directed RNA polymerase specialized sigma24 family protein
MDGAARELEALYETRYVSFRSALATVTGSRESARDAVQEAFAHALVDPELNARFAALADTTAARSSAPSIMRNRFPTGS